MAAFYLNLHGSYRWVDSLTARTADVTADVDLSSWEGGIGIGFPYSSSRRFSRELMVFLCG